MTTRRVQPEAHPFLLPILYDHFDAISPRTAFTRRCRIKTEGGNLATPCLRGDMATARDHPRQGTQALTEKIGSEPRSRSN